MTLRNSLKTQLIDISLKAWADDNISVHLPVECWTPQLSFLDFYRWFSCAPKSQPKAIPLSKGAELTGTSLPFFFSLSSAWPTVDSSCPRRAVQVCFVVSLAIQHIYISSFFIGTEQVSNINQYFLPKRIWRHWIDNTTYWNLSG